MGRRRSTDAIRRQRLGAAIRAVREQRHLSQADLARAAGNCLSQTDISKIEAGLRWPSIPQLDGIALALGVDSTDLHHVARRSGSATRLTPDHPSQD